ncbi:MAG: NAD-binding protein, partial [Clostridia bacterium]|nr:NAD-binding protein [Clostridia bacterium]
MNIIIVGCGKVGLELAERLSAEGHAVTMMDKNAQLMQTALAPLDVQGVVGNGTSYRAQMEAGILDADLLIAVTDT